MSNELYTELFGFTERPFKLLPDPDFIYWSKGHRRAFSILEYGMVTNAPLTVITGEVGTGKTTLIQALLKIIDSSKTVGLISNAQGGRGDLIRWVLYSLGVSPSPDADYVTLFHEFQNFVINEYANGRTVLLIIDEAQNLSIEALEELRMLTNINSNKDELLQIIIVGQPELRTILARQELRQLAQRVTVTYHINPMKYGTMVYYIRHRLEHVGGSGKEISYQAMRMIFDHSGGIPRLVNKICDIALVYAGSSGHSIVGLGTIREMIRDGTIVPKKKKPLVLDKPVPTDKTSQE